jgi:mannosyltransferase OCH1-like enzyme
LKLFSIWRTRLIPKTVHLTFKDFKSLPIEIHRKNDALELRNPNYTFCYYDDAQISNWINENCDFEISQIFNKINEKYGVVRADLFRYLIIHKVGGIYLDIKSNCLVPFDELIQPHVKFITSHWSNVDGTIDSYYGNHKSFLLSNLIEFQQWFLIAEPRHYIMEEVVSAAIQNLKMKQSVFSAKFGRLGVLETSGPIMFTKVLSKFEQGTDFTVINSKAEGLVYSIYDDSSISSHYKLFPNHYSTLFEPILKTSATLSVISKYYNRFLKQYYLRLELKLLMLIFRR